MEARAFGRVRGGEAGVVKLEGQGAQGLRVARRSRVGWPRREQTDRELHDIARPSYTNDIDLR